MRRFVSTMGPGNVVRLAITVNLAMELELIQK
jgi:hypothetical protein